MLSYELGALFYPSLVGKRVAAPFSCVETVGPRPVRCLANARPRLDEGETDKDGEATFVHAKTRPAMTISPRGENGDGADAVSGAPDALCDASG